jgi:hypothetical protein
LADRVRLVRSPVFSALPLRKSRDSLTNLKTTSHFWLYVYDESENPITRQS